MCKKFLENIKIRLNPRKCPTCGWKEVETIFHSRLPSVSNGPIKEVEIICANCKRLKSVYGRDYAFFCKLEKCIQTQIIQNF